MKQIPTLVGLAAICILISCQKRSLYERKTAESNGYRYEYVTDDPLKVRIYTLKNGLKVYMSQYDAQPRIQTQIAVKAGGKNDPADNTGLAHYLEHIMFKGTSDFGTLDWTKEAVYLDSLERMFTHYASLSDSADRAHYYRQIDEVSNEASKHAIAAEYDKMVSEIGARGTNAYTSEDRTVYINDIPANQIENWIKIEANRFRQIVPRLFHTELEAVYEEKNRSLDNDHWKTYEALYTGTFAKHPYGTQTVIGTIDHLKNPSITAIKKYFDTYYRPNNVAICLSGDLDYDRTIALLDKHFGDWKPNNELPQWNGVEEDPINGPVVKEIYGPDAEWVNIGFRFKGRSSREYGLLQLTDMILANAQAGLIDINLKQQQKVLQPGSYIDALNEYCIHTFTGRPREGQSLDEVKNLLLEQIELLKKGQFEDWLIEATINDLKINRLRGSEQNWSRSNDLVIAFTNDIPWENYTAEIDNLRKISKEDIVKFANENYKDNYVVVYKRNGKDTSQKKVTKPPITKVTLNKESKSHFHKRLAETKVDKLQPVFLDYDSDIQKLKMNRDVEVLYMPNKENSLFSLYYVTDVGTNNDPKIKVAIEYLQYLGTDEMSSEDFKKEFYKIGCNFGVFASEDQTYVYLEGLDENLDKSIVLFERLLANPKADDEALKKMIDGIFKKREDTKKNKAAILYSGLLNYGFYGKKSPFTNVLSNRELRELKAEELTGIIKGFSKTQHRVLYYGPRAQGDLVASLNEHHLLPNQLLPVPPAIEFSMMDVKRPKVFWTHYDMVQAEAVYTMKGPKYNKDLAPLSRMYNEYISAQTFQELREAQGLAYSTWTYYGTAGKANGNDMFYSYIGTQADKQAESMAALKNIVINMPETEDGFRTAKEAVLNQIESERIIKSGVLFNYLSAQRRGLDYDIRKDIYDKARTMTLADIKKFHEENIKNARFNTVLIGNREKIDFNDLRKYGEVQELTLDEIFGYEKVQKIEMEATAGQ